MSSDPTRELLERWHAGDRAAVVELIERDRDWILERVRRGRGAELQRDADTVDHFQDLVLEALEYAPRFVVANRSQFRSLMARMVDNLLTDRARWLGRRRGIQPRSLASWSTETRLHLDQPVGGTAGPATAAERHEDLDWLRLGLEFLDAGDRRLVHEHKLLGRSFVELGSELELEPNTVRMRYQRAVMRLAGILRRLRGGRLDELLG